MLLFEIMYLNSGTLTHDKTVKGTYLSVLLFESMYLNSDTGRYASNVFPLVRILVFIVASK